MNTPMLPRTFLTIALALSSFAPATIRAGQAPPPQTPQTPPTFRAGIDLMQVDVSVFDKDRHPVHGLTAEDFLIREDGKPQHIEHFEEITLPDPVEPTAKWMRRVSRDVATNDFQERRLWIIVLDDAMCIYEPFAIKKSKEIAQMVVNKLGENDLAAVVFTRDNRNTQDFTNDRARLSAAIDKFTAGFAFAVPRPPPSPTAKTKPPFLDQYYFQSSVRTVASAANYLIAIPQRRKALVYISIGLPLDFGALANVKMGSGGDIEKRELMVTLYEQLVTALENAQRGNVNVYAFDPAGGGGLAGFFASHPNAASATPAPAGAYADYLRTIADDTGGRAVIDANEFGAGVDRMFQENGSFYLIGYRQTNPRPPGQFNRLEVKLPNRPGLEVRARHVNYAPRTEETKAIEKGTPPPPELTALSGLLPDPSAPLRMAAAPFAAAGTKQGASVAIVLGLREDTPKERLAEHVSVIAKAFTPEGDEKASVSQTVDVRLGVGTHDRGAAVRYEVLSSLAPKPGRYELRVGANDPAAQKSGGVYMDLVVPDFAAEPLSLSGVVLDSVTAPASAPAGAFKPLLPVVPTTEREFSSTSQVSAFLRVYQRAKDAPVAVGLRTMITDDHDRVVTSTSRTLAEAEFAVTHGTDVRFDLPLTALVPGPYLLSFEATAGKAVAARNVVFAVK